MNVAPHNIFDRANQIAHAAAEIQANSSWPCKPPRDDLNAGAELVFKIENWFGFSVAGFMVHPDGDTLEPSMNGATFA